MKPQHYILALVCLALPSVVQAQTSPNGRIRVSAQQGTLIVEYKQKQWQTVMEMPADITADMPMLGSKQKVDYHMLLGKQSHCTNAYQMATYQTANGSQLCVYAYNDGVAWSGIDVKPGDVARNYIVDFAEAQHSWLQKWTDSYEGFFPKDFAYREGDRLAYPALFEYEDGLFALLSESNMQSHNAATSLYCTAQQARYELRPDGPETGGWQTLIVGSLSDIVASTLITDHSQSCKLDDVSWIQPGVASWVYWAYNHGSNDYSIIKRYTDMAAELGLPYVLIDAEWDEMPQLASNEGKTIEDAVKYAVSKGVKPIIWYNSSVGWINGAPGPKFRLNKPEDREKEFAWCEQLGVCGVKIDFFSGDTNLNIAYMIELLECAARHHLVVNFHGATLPRGWQRTYPNLVSTEGVYGAEWYNNRPTLTNKAACHNATLPFTRNVVGSMDYTPCAFTDSQHPHITTHAHELALTALFESGIQHLADRPESFLSQPQPVKDYLGHLPTAWDETRLLSGYPGHHVVLARRKGQVWYVAGINGTDQDLSLSLSWKGLKIKGKRITTFADSGKADAPWAIGVQQGNAAKLLPAAVQMQPRGGFVMVIE